MTLTKADLVEAVWSHTNIPRGRSTEIVETLFELMKQTLESGEHLLISGFGKFQVRQKQERRGRNPHTGKPTTLAPRRVVRFKSARFLRDKINGRV